MIRAAAIALAVLLSGCLRTPCECVPVIEYREVMVPVETRAEVPDALASCGLPPADLRPVFILPSDPAATSALDAEGEARLREMMEAPVRCVEAWRAWSE